MGGTSGGCHCGSLRWHDPDRFKGCDLSRAVARHPWPCLYIRILGVWRKTLPHGLAGRDLFLACQPEGAAAATRILGHVRHNLEAVLVEQGAIFVRRQARMVQRLAAKSADRLAVTRPAVEHERGSPRGMPAEDVEHGALSVLAQVEKAVPSKNAVELPVERQAPHVGHDPGSLRETAAAQCDHGGRGIHAAQFI